MLPTSLKNVCLMPSVFPLFHLGQVGASPAGQVSPPGVSSVNRGKGGSRRALQGLCRFLVANSNPSQPRAAALRFPQVWGKGNLTTCEYPGKRQESHSGSQREELSAPEEEVVWESSESRAGVGRLDLHSHGLLPPQDQVKVRPGKSVISL